MYVGVLYRPLRYRAVTVILTQDDNNENDQKAMLAALKEDVVMLAVTS